MTTIPSWLFWLMAIGDGLAMINVVCWIYLAVYYAIKFRSRPR